MVSDKITKEGFKVGYMYREEPTVGNPDSGWRFMAGNEDDEYMNNRKFQNLVNFIICVYCYSRTIGNLFELFRT